MVNLAFCGSFSKGIFINSTMLGRENLIIERESDISLYFTRLAQKKKISFFCWTSETPNLLKRETKPRNPLENDVIQSHELHSKDFSVEMTFVMVTNL